jgi:hypothetical protein
MRRHAISFFLIALCSELLTTWAQRLRTVSDVEPGLYYPSFKALVFDRLLIWSVVFLGLTGFWLFFTRRVSKK